MSKSVQIVDDDPTLLKILEGKLSALGYSVLKAQNAQECREQIKNHPVDLIILDIMMPEVDGLQLCHDLKIKEGVTIPIVLLTQLDEPVGANVCEEVGAEAYVEKENLEKDLLNIVKRILKD